MEINTEWEAIFSKAIRKMSAHRPRWVDIKQWNSWSDSQKMAYWLTKIGCTQCKVYREALGYIRTKAENTLLKF